jgi:pyridoxine 5-phosphate synthase
VKKRLAELAAGRDFARDWRLVVHAGHGLTYRNIAGVARLEGLCEFNIGHSIVSRAVLVGIYQATREMIELIDKYGPREASSEHT